MILQKIFDFRVVSRTNSCSILESPLHFISFLAAWWWCRGGGQNIYAGGGGGGGGREIGQEK